MPRGLRLKESLSEKIDQSHSYTCHSEKLNSPQGVGGIFNSLVDTVIIFSLELQSECTKTPATHLIPDIRYTSQISTTEIL